MCSWHAHLSSPAAFPGRTSSQGASQVLRAIEPADIPIWLKRLDPGRTKTAEELDALLGEDSNRLLRWACCALACSYPVTRRTGLPNRSSAHSVPPCACATDSADTVSCNDEHYVLSLTVHVHIAAPLFSDEFRFQCAGGLSCVLEHLLADASASTRSSSAFTCLWGMVEYELRPFSTSVCLCHGDSKL